MAQNVLGNRAVGRIKQTLFSPNRKTNRNLQKSGNFSRSTNNDDNDNDDSDEYEYEQNDYLKNGKNNRNGRAVDTKYEDDDDDDNEEDDVDEDQDDDDDAKDYYYKAIDESKNQKIPKLKMIDNGDGSSKNQKSRQSKNELTVKSAGISYLSLPGGSAKAPQTISKNNELQFRNTLGSRCHGNRVGETPRKILVDIRNYLDVLFGSVMHEAELLLITNNKNPCAAIPAVVVSILEYNHIRFKTVKFKITKLDLLEPVWYLYEVQLNELIIFINVAMYDEFCRKNSEVPVVFSSGSMPISILNPFDVPQGFRKNVDLAMRHCAIAADHVATHIINDIYNRKNCIGSSDFHAGFGDMGTTLHSIFQISQHCTPKPRNEFTSDYMSLFSSSINPLQQSFDGLNGVFQSRGGMLGETEGPVNVPPYQNNPYAGGGDAFNNTSNNNNPNYGDVGGRYSYGVGRYRS